MNCWVCQQDVQLNASTCWPLEDNNRVLNAPSHDRCLHKVIEQQARGPGGHKVIQYVRGPQYRGADPNQWK